jgi:M6 family metalloprotease-like protein
MRRLARPLATVWLVAATLPVPAAAQRRGAEAGRFEVPGMDWAPNSAWRRRAEQVRSLRWAMIRQGDVDGLNARPLLLAPGGAAAAAVTGTFHVPVVPIQFQDVNTAYPIQDFQDVLFQTVPPLARPHTLKTYYEEASHGLISMFGRVFDPVRTDSSSTYYQQNCNGIGVLNSCADGGRRFGLMLIAVLDSISNRPGADTVWSRFDNDGPDGLPNSGDDDGDVDFVTFLQPVRDGACQPSPGIWAHRYVMTAWNSGSKYVTKTPRRNAQGQPIPGSFIAVNNYTIQSQVGGSTGCDAAAIMPVGTVAHETGHAFGLPDLYDTDRTGSGTEGIGEWGIMGSGNYTTSHSPTGFDAWSLNELGWVTIAFLTDGRMVTTGPRQLTDTVFLAATDDPNEWLLIENRQAFESDTAMLNQTTTSVSPTCRSNCRKSVGLLLWHIDRNRIQSGRAANRVNTGPVQGVALIQADGLNQLRSTGAARNRGDHGDPYPGSTASPGYTLRSAPAARTNFNEYVGFIIDQVEQLANGVMRFRFLRRAPTLVRSGLAGATVLVNGQPWGRFEDVIPQGDQFTIGADTVQITATGRTRARFLAWSNGGPRIQTITSGVKPDTIAASFSAEHRLLVTISGNAPGTVTATRPGDLAAGVFLAEGTPVTLIATAQPGGVFSGWRGIDTTAAGPTITLPMAHAYDVEASFVLEVAVTVADATAEILGTPVLTAEQKTFLDLVGNRNAFFDLGDYLALLRRGGQAVPPAVLQAAAERERRRGRGS